MNLGLPFELVTGVLLADGWHNVEGESFAVHQDERNLQVWYPAFSFTDDDGDEIGGPLASVLAVRHDRSHPDALRKLNERDLKRSTPTPSPFAPSSVS